MTKKTLKYKTEVQQLLDLMIHSLYSNRDIFLRELVSNSSDAIDRLKFDALTNQDLLENSSDWKIQISYNKAARTITISDNGIGMTAEEVKENIGTIAKSGTKQFLKELQDKNQANNPEFIGQFGVGFYSAFMVADKVTLTTRRASQPAESAVTWESAGDGSYTLEDTTRADRGTEITLHMKEDAGDYLSDWKIKEIIKHYSDYIEHPVLLDSEDARKDKKENEPLNSRKAIWTKAKKDITQLEYNDFYKHVAHDYNDPAETIHLHAEGSTEFKALLYIPEKAPMDIFWRDYKGGLSLYVRRVFIMHDCKKLIPEYLRFLKGVVDSGDLPLNVSREILQEDKNIDKIKSNITKKVLKTLQTLQGKERDKYNKLYKEFGKILKEGLSNDYENKDTLKELIMFESTSNPAGQMITLKEYREKMPADQKEIYYITGDNRNDIENSPLLEAFKNKGYDVLLMTDPIDEFITTAIHDYDTKPLKSAERGDIEIDEQSKKAKEEKEKEHKDLLAVIMESLKAEVKQVRFSTRLRSSASCLVADDYTLTRNMEHLMKAMGQTAPEEATKRILELNPDHTVIQAMQKIHTKEPGNPRLKDYSVLLFDQALINEGSKIKNPQRFTQLVSELMTGALEGN